jgi:hypothetical protein
VNRRLFRAFVLLLCKRRGEKVRDRKQGWAEFFSPPRRFKTYFSREIRFFEPQALVTRRATFSCLVRSAESPYLVGTRRRGGQFPRSQSPDRMRARRSPSHLRGV